MDDATPLLSRALEGRERKLGPDHPSTLTRIKELPPPTPVGRGYARRASYNILPHTTKQKQKQEQQQKQKQQQKQQQKQK